MTGRRRPAGKASRHPAIGRCLEPDPVRNRPRGSIEQLASGSLRVRVYAGVDVLSGRAIYLKEVIPAGPSARRLAEQRRAELIRQIDEGRQPRTNASVAQLVRRHLDMSEVEPRTRCSLEGYLRNHVAPLIGRVPIGSVNAETLDTYYAELRRCRRHCDGGPVLHHRDGPHTCDRRCRAHTCTPLAAATIRKIHYLLNAAYANAVRWNWIAVNPMEQARKPPPPAPDPQPPTAEETAALLTECWKWGLGPFVWLAITTGARRGELCALRWQHLQVRHTQLGEHDCFAAGCRWWLVIRRAIGEAEGRLWETDTKTHQRRHVALDPDTVAMLLEHRRQCERRATAIGARLTDECFMFAAGPDGRDPSTPSSTSQRYQRCAKRLGIRTSLKALRHYSATELITAGVDIRTVAGRLGHGSGGTTTLKVYAAWVAAADQHASTVLMTRVPPRPAIQISAPARPATFDTRLAHERIAAALHERWRNGTLAPGTVLKVKVLALEHGVSVGTAHSVLTRLAELNVVEVRTGRPTVVLDPNDQPTPREAQSAPPRSEPDVAVLTVAETTTATGRQALVLELRHLGTRLRTMRTMADPEDLETLHQMLLDSVRRHGGDQARVGDYELTVLVTGNDEPYTTVVAA